VTLCNPQNKNIVNRQILERLPTVLLSLRPLWELQVLAITAVDSETYFLVLLY